MKILENKQTRWDRLTPTWKAITVVVLVTLAMSAVLLLWGFR